MFGGSAPVPLHRCHATFTFAVSIKLVCHISRSVYPVSHSCSVRNLAQSCFACSEQTIAELFFILAITHVQLTNAGFALYQEKSVTPSAQWNAVSANPYIETPHKSTTNAVDRFMISLYPFAHCAQHILAEAATSWSSLALAA